MRLIVQFTSFVYSVEVAAMATRIGSAQRDTIDNALSGLLLEFVVLKSLSLHGIRCRT